MAYYDRLVTRPAGEPSDQALTRDLKFELFGHRRTDSEPPVDDDVTTRTSPGCEESSHESRSTQWLNLELPVGPGPPGDLNPARRAGRGSLRAGGSGQGPWQCEVGTGSDLPVGWAKVLRV